MAKGRLTKIITAIICAAGSAILILDCFRGVAPFMAVLLVLLGIGIICGNIANCLSDYDEGAAGKGALIGGIADSIACIIAVFLFGETSSISLLIACIAGGAIGTIVGALIAALTGAITRAITRKIISAAAWESQKTPAQRTAEQAEAEAEGIKMLKVAAVITVIAAIIGAIVYFYTVRNAADYAFNSAFNFVSVRAGTFAMGSGAEEKDEGPEHKVTLTKPFYISRWEVTQAEYEEVMGINPSHFKGKSLPVETVTWYDAIEYCNARSEKEGLEAVYAIDKDTGDPNNKNESDSIKWTVTWNRKANGFRLPTEAEWEYCCRAGTKSPYGLNDLGTYFNDHPKKFFHFNAKRTLRVGKIGNNNWGIKDMLGNVWEWCWDWEGPYSSAAQTNPTGASSGEYREQRGGSWSDKSLTYLRSANRGRVNPAASSSNLGFRLVRNGEEI
jgi:formylglycine-generating enzyme required for sulfatase activity